MEVFNLFHRIVANHVMQRGDRPRLSNLRLQPLSLNAQAHRSDKAPLSLASISFAL